MAKGKNPNPLSDADVSEFHRYMKKWQGLLNLRDWRIEPGSTRSKAMADVTTDHGARLARYRVGEDFGATPVTPQSLEETAIHELLHVVLTDVLDAVDKKLDPVIVESREHAVINLFERLLMDAYGDR